ncbi:hypothetical protein BGZ51_001070 [Haplosporangium sp. Z 767]|nr:hypothetical protein BGZ51_001070 [Haplosporangium sp. Z 767]
MAQPPPNTPLLPQLAPSDRIQDYGSRGTEHKDEATQMNPEATASAFSKMTLSWMDPIFKIGYRRHLQESDLFEMLPQRKAAVLGQRLNDCWNQERRKAAMKGQNPSLLRAMIQFGLPMYWFGQIIKYLKDAQDESSSPSSWYGYGLAVILLVTCMVQSQLALIWVISSVKTAALLRTALVHMIFQKTTTMSSKARLEYSDGAIFNFMSTDTARIEDCLSNLVLLVAVPLAVLITVVMLYYLMGPSALVGIFVLMIVNPLQAWSLTKCAPIRAQASKLTDTRVRMTTEILQGIKVIKFFAFEPSFLKKLSEVRFSELKFVSYLLQVRSFIYSTSSSLPVFASALSFVLYSILGNKLEPEIVFPALALFTGLRVPLLVLPYCYSEATDAWVSTKRIEKFLLSLDSQPLPPIDKDHKYALSIQHADFYWDQMPSTDASTSSLSTSSSSSSVSENDTPGDSINEEQQPLLSGQDSNDAKIEIKTSLRDINLDISRGSLVAIVGAVGSGKSSILQAMIGNMMMSQGEIIRGGSISYASQTPWIQNTTIRDNILFDTPLDEDRYWRVIKACSLEKDLENLPFGDKTEIGERGANLSGGQKARLSLARSVYYNAEIVIMDDPLSAVDAHVGKRLWEDCVLQELASKTRIIATHQLHVLPDVDYYGGHHDGKNTIKRRIVKRSRSSAGKIQVTDEIVESGDDSTMLQESEESSDEPILPTSQMTEEERATGAISRDVYREYFGLGGRFNWLTIVFLFFAQQAVGVAMNVWLSFWSADRLKLSTWTYINVYISSGVVQLMIAIVGSFMMVLAVIKSSRLLHDRAFLSVLYSPMSFFDTTPMGRILNRFSKDIDTIDSTLMNALNSFLITITGIVSVLVLSAVFLPWMIPVMVLLTLIYYHVAVFFQRTNRELKRLESLLRSHLYAYFSETLNGITTLKAYHQHGVNKAIARNQHNLDRHNKAYYHNVMALRWITLRVFAVGHILNFVAVILIVWARSSIDPATAGLVLSYLARLASEMSYSVQTFAHFESIMTSAERVLYYANSLEQEPLAHIPDRKPDPSWPSEGHVCFRDVSMRYRPELPLVLNDISFDISSGGKVAVVGRTGAGKSSLIQALFRLVDLDSGGVVIDGIDTSTIGTADLRSKIAIIPQDPVLFQGTFRYNLDPLSRHSEQELWQALETSDLKAFVQQQEGGLDGFIAAQGENLSAGQRQLVCLARALLAKSKVVVLDEGEYDDDPATASVDLATDSLIQKAIRVDFADSTVITIAHRLNTVIDYHRVLIMDQGRVAEYDTPRRLLKDPNSAFSRMVDETGGTNAALLRTLAGC